MSNSQRIYDAARRYLGIQETPGPQSTASIRQWITAAADWLDGDDS